MLLLVASPPSICNLSGLKIKRSKLSISLLFLLREYIQIAPRNATAKAKPNRRKLAELIKFAINPNAAFSLVCRLTDGLIITAGSAFFCNSAIVWFFNANNFCISLICFSSAWLRPCASCKDFSLAVASSCKAITLALAVLSVFSPSLPCRD